MLVALLKGGLADAVPSTTAVAVTMMGKRALAGASVTVVLTFNCTL